MYEKAFADCEKYSESLRENVKIRKGQSLLLSKKLITENVTVYMR